MCITPCIYMADPGPELDWGTSSSSTYKLMDNFNNEIQLLLQEQDELKKNKNQNKKKKSRNINSSGGTSSCVNNSASTGSSSSSSSSKGGGGGGGVMKLSTDPQSVAARQRRHRISDKLKMLQSLIPGGTSNKMDTVSMLEEAIHYIKFLKTQLCLQHTIMMNSIKVQHEPVSSSPSSHHDDDLFLNSFINFNSSPTTNVHVNNMINNLSLYSSPPPPPVQYPPQSPHQFRSSSSSTSSSTTYNIPAAAAGISGMPPLHQQ